MDDIKNIKELYDYVLATLTSNLDWDCCDHSEEDIEGGSLIHIPYDSGEVVVKITISENCS